MKLYDVIIVGGGPAGLSSALVLGRSRRTVCVIDEGKPRNGVTYESHGFLTRDGVKPKELRRIAHEQLLKYKHVDLLENDAVTEVEHRHSFFYTRTKEGNEIKSKKIIFATGLKEHLLDIPGLEEVYGTTVFLCPYCDGWERKDQPLALIGNSKSLFHFIKLVYNWSHDLIVFSNGQAMLTELEKHEISERGIQLLQTPISKIHSNNGFLTDIELVDGEKVKRSGGFLVDTRPTQSTLIPEGLGVQLNEKGEYNTEAHGKTNVEGLFIIGDAKNTFTSVVGAASEGYELGVYINQQLVEEYWADVNKT